MFGRARIRLRHSRNTLELGGIVVAAVVGLVLLHAVEIGAYAVLYLLLGELPDVESALYFSASTFTTLGYGDVVIAPGVRLVAAMEGIAGFLMLGWSTAFLVSVVAPLQALESHPVPGHDEH